ncbi:MAG: RHS repeat-associated core domain-containing protein [Candidatus Binatia bacterium]
MGDINIVRLLSSPKEIKFSAVTHYRLFGNFLPLNLSKTNYVYDALNRLTSLTSPQGTSTFAYDGLSRRTGLTLPNGASTAYTYDAASQLTELLNTIGATTISRFAYTYDAVGNRVTRSTTNGIATYDYDTLNRLTQAIQPDPIDPLQQLTETFAYDPVGNRTSSHLATGQVHDAANRLLEDSSFTYTYDANGSLMEQTAKATGDRTVYTYNVENQLIRVEKFTVAGGLSPVLTAEYRYDALGRRIEKNVNGVITRYVYDNEDILVELDSTNAVVARYTHGPGIDEPLIMFHGGQPFFYHADGLGSVWDLTDSAGAVARSFTYDSFGQLVAETGILVNPYTFTAREFDPETGLYYYRARHYMPSIGRFLQTDPLFALNLYSYVRNNPVNFTDPRGLQAPGFRPFSLNAGRVLIPGLPDLTLPFMPTKADVRAAIFAKFGSEGLEMFDESFREELRKFPIARRATGSTLFVKSFVVITRSPFSIRVLPFSFPADDPSLTMGRTPGQRAQHTFFFVIEAGLPGESCPLFPLIRDPRLRLLERLP